MYNLLKWLQLVMKWKVMEVTRLMSQLAVCVQPPSRWWVGYYSSQEERGESRRMQSSRLLTHAELQAGLVDHWGGGRRYLILLCGSIRWCSDKTVDYTPIYTLCVWWHRAGWHTGAVAIQIFRVFLQIRDLVLCFFFICMFVNKLWTVKLLFFECDDSVGKKRVWFWREWRLEH